MMIPEPAKRCLAVLLLAASAAMAQTAGGASPGGGSFRVLRSMAGSQGAEQNGRFVIADPRSVFHVPADKKVLVYFDWEGPLGEHNFEGYWKNPEGKVVVISDYKFTARQRRFGGYWQLDLTPSTAAGIWTLEARIDGEVTGSHSFQVVHSEQPAEVAKRRFRTPAEQYKSLLASRVTLQKLDSAGRVVSSGLGFVLTKGEVVTAFQSVDGASTLRLRFPDGRTAENPVVAWFDRMRDVAVLRAETAETPTLERAPNGAWAVGDHVFALDVAPEGGVVIKEESIFGLNDSPQRGPRINITDLHSPAASGGALVNDYGEAIGVVGGALFPGMPARYTANLQPLNFATQGSLATPLSTLPPQTPPGGRTLAELNQAGEFIVPLKPSQDILNGALGDEVKRGKKNQPANIGRTPKNEFSRTQGKIGLTITWNPRTKVKGTLLLRVYDLGNRLINEAKPLSLKVGGGDWATTDWSFDITHVPSGTYRVDVWLDKDPVWRGFMQITD
jgi:S1-C subfamily serine protease